MRGHWPIIRAEWIGGQLTGVHQAAHGQVGESIANSNRFLNCIAPYLDLVSFIGFSLADSRSGMVKDLVFAGEDKTDIDVLIQSQAAVGAFPEGNQSLAVSECCRLEKGATPFEGLSRPGLPNTLNLGKCPAGGTFPNRHFTSRVDTAVGIGVIGGDQPGARNAPPCVHLNFTHDIAVMVHVVNH